MVSHKLHKYVKISPFFLLPLFVIILLLILESTQTNYFLYDDNAVQFLPYFVYNWRALLEHGSLPFINFHQYLGYPYIGTGSSAVLYLPVYISVLISKLLAGDVYSSIDVFAFIHLMLASIGMFLLLRRLNIDIVICFLISLMWISFPFIINVSRAWIFVSATAAFLPFNFLFLDQLMTDSKSRNALFVAITKSAYFYLGYIQYVFMTFAFEIFYVVIQYTLRSFSSREEKIKQAKKRLISENRSRIEPLAKFTRSYLISILFFLCLSAPLFIPMLFLQQESALRSTKVTLKNFLSWPIFWSDFLKAQIYHFKQNVIFAGDSEIYYFGLVNLFLLFLIAFKRFRKDPRFLSFVLVAIIALFSSTRFYGIFYHLPGFNLFRWPFKNFLFFLFFASVGVAGIANIMTNLSKSRFNSTRIVIYSIFSLSVLLNCYVLRTSTGADHVFASMHIESPPIIPLEGYIPKEKGRVFTLWVNSVKSRDRYKYFTYDFATLFGYFHLGGYDMLVSRINNRLALGLNHINSYTDILNKKLLDYLTFMSVKYLVTHDNIYTRRLIEISQLRLRYEKNNILVYENTRALPLAYYLDKPWHPIDSHFGVNEIYIHPENSEEKTIAVNVAPLRWFYVYLDGTRAGRIKKDEYPIKIRVPRNTKTITIKYVDYPFYGGLSIFIVFWIGLLVYGLHSRSKNNQGK